MISPQILGYFVYPGPHVSDPALLQPVIMKVKDGPSVGLRDYEEVKKAIHKSELEQSFQSGYWEAIHKVADTLGIKNDPNFWENLAKKEISER